MEMEKAVAFTILPISWDQAKSYCLKNNQRNCKEQHNQKQVPLCLKFGGNTQFSVFFGEIAVK